MSSSRIPENPLSPGAIPPPARPKGFLDWIEWAGNQLPEPALLFASLAVIIVILSAVGSAAGWRVQPVRPSVVLTDKLDDAGRPVLDEAGAPRKVPQRGADGRLEVQLVEVGQPIQPRNLLTSDGVYWMLSSMLRNFTGLPALGLIFVAILGIGVAEKFGFFSALMRFLAIATPSWLLTPVIVLIGANSSVASDAGYIILPPLAAALYQAVGRHPIAGLAAAFAGVAGGFGGGFFPTGGDGALTGFAQDAARIIEPSYTITILHNLYFKAMSAIVVMLAGWFVTDRIVEPRLRRVQPVVNDDDVGVVTDMALKPAETRALLLALGAKGLVLACFAYMILTPGMPLAGDGQPTLADGRVLVQQPVSIYAPDSAPSSAPARSALLAEKPLLIVDAPGRRGLLESPQARWSHVIVPIMFFAFLTPGVVFGWLTGKLRSQKDLIEALYHGIRSIVPVLAIAFFMAQFVNYFAYTRLDRMLAYAGGSLLVEADLPTPALLALFVMLVICGDFAISGMLSKFGVLAPIFIPMFMMVGMSPELTTAAYRIGDSVVNIITPMNSYLLIILMVLQKYQKGAGLGSLISLMLPYSFVFAIVWTGFLLLYYWMNFDLGPSAPMHYTPST